MHRLNKSIKTLADKKTYETAKSVCPNGKEN